MLKRLLPLLGLTACQVIATPQVTGFKCGEGRACEGGFTCCSDDFCRLDCTLMSAGGGSGGNAGGTGGTGGSGGGGGNGCTFDVPCTGNPGACKIGRTGCVNDVAVCMDAQNATDGITCTTGICSVGQCVACTDGLACGTNPNRCVDGKLACASGVPTCNDGTTMKTPGSSCGTDQVCDPTGACIACAQGAACTTNTNVCKNGTTACSSGTPQCSDGSDKAAGVGCGTGKVCDGSGACITCVDGAACSTNPDKCKSGTLSCTAGAPTCNDGAAKLPGSSCGTNLVCNPQGACIACTAMQSCSTNPGVCKQGVTSCTTGASVCTDGTANKTPGASCGTNQVCDATGGCIACTAGATCNTNPNKCKVGNVQCSTGAVVCVDTAANVTNGTPCGTGGSMTCNSGFCGTCVQGSTCTGNPNPCKTGTQDCSGSAPACNDGSGNVGAGTTCNTNMVCNGAGSCVACTAGTACTTNPNACKAGVTSCATGAQTCVNGADLALGTLCSGGFCSGAGTCTACNLGAVCTGNPSPCRTGAYARGGTGMAQCVCIDSGNQMNGTSCGASTYGAYGSCSYSGTCDNAGSRTRTRTDFVCTTGSCGTTTATETDTAGCMRNTNGTNCGASTYTAYGACSYSGTCDNSGSRTRVRTDYACAGGGCGTSTATETDTAGCARNTNNNTCSGGFCFSGGCNACAVGGGCSTNPGAPCMSGVKAWNTGSGNCDCNDSTVVPNIACSGGCCSSTGTCIDGCINSSGACVAGTLKSACGNGGFMCISCPGIGCTCDHAIGDCTGSGCL